MMGVLRRLIRWESALVVVLVAEIAIFGAMNPRFIDPARMLSSMSDFVYFGIIALPLALIMMSGGIDISFGSMVSLAAISMGVLYQLGMSIWLAAVVGIIVGGLAGLFNGAIVVTTGVQPMVVTLGTQFLFAGLALGASGLGGVSAFEGISGLPDGFLALASGKVAGIPNLVIFFAVFALAFWLLSSRTTFGRRIRLIGISPRASTHAGLPVKATLVQAYVLMGLCCGVVGVLLTSYFGSARADLGSGLLLPALTLVVIGGVSMYGGEGSIVGVVIATFVIGFLQRGLRFLELSENQVSVAVGLALVVVASLRWWTGHLSERLKNARVQKTQVGVSQLA